jgi:hypothetical protein
MMMVDLLLVVGIISLLAGAALGLIAANELHPYLPPQFSDPLMSRYAFIEVVFQRRIPLAIQFKALCSTVFGCIALGSFTLLCFLKPQNGPARYLSLIFFLVLLYASVVAYRKYRANRVSR